MRKKIIFGIMLVLFITMVGINFYTPLYSDDLYMTQYKSVMDIWNASVDDYFNWNGRFIGQTLFRLLVYIPSWLFALVNAAIFCIFVFVTFLLSSKNWKNLSPLKLVIVISLFVLFIPSFGQTILWRAGAGNYLWTTTIILSMILPYYSHFFETHEGLLFPKRILYPYLTIFGIAAGLSNENTSGGLLLCLLGFLGYEYFHKKKVAWWQVYGFMATLFGFLILLMSPGNKIRTAATVGSDYLTLKNMVLWLLNITEALYNEHLWLFVGIAVCATLALLFWFDKKKYLMGGFFTIIGLATIYALIMSPLGHEGGRPFFGGLVFLILGLLNFFPDEKTSDVTRKIYYPFVSALLVVTLFTAVVGLKDYYYSSQAIKARYDFVESQIDSSDRIEAQELSYQPQSRFSINYGLEDIGEDEYAFPNSGYQVYFGIKGIILKD